MSAAAESSRLFLLQIASVVLLTGFPHLATGGPSAGVVGLPLGPGLRMDPYFVEGQPKAKNVSVHTGQTAYLECRVRNLGAKRVSWVRHRDVHILAVGGATFTSDKRFSSLYLEDEGRFTLVIKKVKLRDQGVYECQISTKPTKSLFVHLQVSVPKIDILSESAKHVEQQSALNLTCVVSAVASEDGGQQWPKMVWYKDGKLIDNYVGGRGLIIEKVIQEATVSNIYVGSASVRDSGNYTCEAPALAANASVNVHVLVDGESPNAWKSNAASNVGVKCPMLLFWITITQLVLSRRSGYYPTKLQHLFKA